MVGNSQKHKSKLFSLFVVIIVLLTSSTSVVMYFCNKSSAYEIPTNLSISLNFPYPEISNVSLNNRNFTEVRLPDCILEAEIGAPCLPFYPAKILIPNEMSVTEIRVSNDNPIDIYWDAKNKPIVPQQEMVPFSVDQNKIKFTINETLYNSINYSGHQLYISGDVGYCRGYPILNVRLYPIIYQPKNGTLKYIPKIEIEIELESNDGARLDGISGEKNGFYRNKNRDKDFIQDLVENPESIKTYEKDFENTLGEDTPMGGDGSFGDGSFSYDGGICDPLDAYEYVIITNNALRDVSGYSYNWTDLIDHRYTYSGLNGIIVTVEDINSCKEYWNSTATFNDTQARIREFCKDAYKDWETEYILLGGDWDGTASHQIVPYRLFTDRYETDTYKTMACDMYYSHLDGDWYYSAQSIWGGGRNSGVNDFYAELFVARICAYDGDMVSNAVGKIINYDTNTSLTNSWLKTASFWGGDLGWSVTSKQYMEEIRLGTDTYRTFTGFEEWNTANPSNAFDTSERLYHADIGATYKTYFSNSVEDDNASIVNHLDHSSYNTPFGLTNWQFRYNTMPFFGYSQGCLAGRFHSGYAGCEQMICRHPERHAYGLVLNTGYGYGNSGSTDGASQYVQAYFWDYFFGNQSHDMNKWQLGRAMAYAHDKMASVVNSRSHAWCYAWYSAHLFGDPAQMLRIGDVNLAPSISNENPSDSAIDTSVNLSSLSVTIIDTEGDFLNWTIETSPDVGSDSGNNEGNGTKTCIVSGLSYDTTYYWFVNVTDGNSWTNDSFSFTTEQEPINNPPVIFSSTIENGSTGVSVSSSILSVNIQDPEGDSFNWTIETSPDVGSNSATLENNGSKTCDISGLIPGTVYNWFVNATDGNTWTRKWYTFTTSYTPITNGAVPANKSINVDLEIGLLEINIEDLDGDAFNWSIQTSPDAGSASGNSESNGSKTCIIGTLDFDTTYYWFVNVSDGNSWTNCSYYFTTRSSYQPETPVGFSADADGRFAIDLTWTADDEADLTYIEWNTISGPWNRVEGNLLYNGSMETTSQSGLLPSTTRYYQAWSWNNTDGLWSSTHASDSATTIANSAPIISSESPSNQSIDIDVSTNLISVFLQDSEGDSLNWTIETSPDIGSSFANNEGNGSKSCSISGLSYDTTYYWFVNCSDDYVWTNSTFYFTTENKPPNAAPIVSSPSVANESIDVSIKTSIVSVNIVDLEGDDFNWTIETSPDVGSSGGNNENNGTKSCSISGLDFDTTYYWFVNVSDGNSWTNCSYYFTTRSSYQPETPVGFSADADGRFAIDLTWTADDEADSTYIEWNTISGPWNRGEGNLLYNGSMETTSQSGLLPSTTRYYQAWSWNNTDGLWSSTHASDSATTIANSAPIISSESPSNQSIDIDVSTNLISVFLQDSEGDNLDWTIQTSPDVGSSSGSNENNGTKTCSVSGLLCDTTYYWYANVTDGNNLANKTYQFTTRQQYMPEPPTGFSATPSSRDRIDISWSNDDEADLTRIEWSETPDPWSLGGRSVLYNGSGITTSHSGLDPITTVYYQSWSFNNTDFLCSATFSSASATTYANDQVVVSAESPVNLSSNIEITFDTLSINIEDPEGDNFDWTIETSPDIGFSSGSNENNGTKTCSVSGMSYDTTYYWFVSATDGCNFTNVTFLFTTEGEPSNFAPILSSPSVSNGTSGVSIDLSSLSLIIQDPEGDSINWSIETQPDIGSTSATIDSNGSKVCSISGLEYDSSYKWFVNATDRNNWTRVYYLFTTCSAPPSPPQDPPSPPGPPLPPPENESQPDENNAPGIPHIVFGPSTIEPGVVYLFSVSCNDSDGDKIRVRFDWGDGNISDWTPFVNSDDLANVTNTWGAGTNYSIRVIAQDIHGLNSSWSNSYEVIMLFNNKVNNETTKEENISYIEVNKTITFNGSTLPNNSMVIVSWVWDFGDGETGIGRNQVHYYKKPGDYVVSIVMTDKEGDTFTETMVVRVTQASSESLPEESKESLLYILSISIISIVSCVAVAYFLLKKRGLVSIHTATGGQIRGLQSHLHLRNKDFKKERVKKDKETDKRLSLKYFAQVQSWYDKQEPDDEKAIYDEIKSGESLDNVIEKGIKTDNIRELIDVLTVKYSSKFSLLTEKHGLLENKIDELIHGYIVNKVENL